MIQFAFFDTRQQTKFLISMVKLNSLVPDDIEQVEKSVNLDLVVVVLNSGQHANVLIQL